MSCVTPVPALAASTTASLTRRFLRDTSGNFALMFGLIALPLMCAIGAAIDYSQSIKVKTEAQNVLDAAVLAGGTRMNIDSDAEVEQLVRAFIAKNTKVHGGNGTIVVNDVAVDTSDSKVRADATTNVSTSFMRILGFNEVSINLSAEAALGNRSFEVALVLDNSGSMAGTKIQDLRTAAGNLTDILFGATSTNPKMSIGVVPFAGLVNVGAQNANASWIDADGDSSIHKTLYDGTMTRFELYDDMNVAWRGCVEARPDPYDTDDTEPTTSDPDTLFVPSFAPDEPDGNTNYYNSYLPDNGGTCTVNANLNSLPCPNPHAAVCSLRQKKTCKYDSATADTSLYAGTRKGPNFLCDSSPITPLSHTKSDATDAFGLMEAYGGTNIHEAVAWGWRVLSPGEPFTEGKSYDTEENKKIMVLMTDGENTLNETYTHTYSTYSAYGYITDGRLDTGGLHTSAAAREAMNAKTLQTCTNAKAKGIEIYTVAFNVTATATLDMLRACASSSSMAYTSSNGAHLIQTFEQIAQQINKLRLTR